MFWKINIVSDEKLFVGFYLEISRNYKILITFSISLIELSSQKFAFLIVFTNFNKILKFFEKILFPPPLEFLRKHGIFLPFSQLKKGLITLTAIFSLMEELFFFKHPYRSAMLYRYERVKYRTIAQLYRMNH